MHAGHDNRVRPDMRFVADYHLFQVERLFVRIPGAVAISVVEARDEDVLAQSHAVAQPDGADHYRADTDARAVADQYVARAVVDRGKIFDQRIAAYFETAPRKNIDARAPPPDDRTPSAFVYERVDEPFDPQTGSRILVRSNQADDKSFQGRISFDFVDHVRLLTGRIIAIPDVPDRDDKYFLFYTNIDKFRYPGNLFSEISYHIDLMLFLFPENICSFIFSVMIL